MFKKPNGSFGSLLFLKNFSRLMFFRAVSALKGFFSTYLIKEVQTKQFDAFIYSYPASDNAM